MPRARRSPSALKIPDFRTSAVFSGPEGALRFRVAVRGMIRFIEEHSGIPVETTEPQHKGIPPVFMRTNIVDKIETSTAYHVENSRIVRAVKHAYNAKLSELITDERMQEIEPPARSATSAKRFHIRRRARVLISPGDSEREAHPHDNTIVAQAICAQLPCSSEGAILATREQITGAFATSFARGSGLLSRRRLCAIRPVIKDKYPTDIKRLLSWLSLAGCGIDVERGGHNKDRQYRISPPPPLTPAS